MKDCPFCKPLHEDGTKAWDLGDFFIKANIAPYKQEGAENHLMLIPKKHIKYLKDFKPQELERFWSLVTQISDEFRKQHGSCVHWFRQNAARQSQEHLHYHFLPNDEFIGVVEREEYTVPTIDLSKII